VSCSLSSFRIDDEDHFNFPQFHSRILPANLRPNPSRLLKYSRQMSRVFLFPFQEYDGAQPPPLTHHLNHIIIIITCQHHIIMAAGIPLIFRTREVIIETWTSPGKVVGGTPPRRTSWIPTSPSPLRNSFTTNSVPSSPDSESFMSDEDDTEDEGTYSHILRKLMCVASLQYKIEMLKDRLALKKMERKLERKYQKLLNKKSLPKQPTLQVPESPTKGAPPLLPPTLHKLLTFLARKTRGGPYVPTKSSPRHRSR